MRRPKVKLLSLVILLSFAGSVSGQILDRKNPSKLKEFIEAAVDQVGKTLFYDPAYVKLSYPNGDIPVEKGVCSDVLIRSFRKIGLDLQKEVHLDMKKNFGRYPQRWGLKNPDTNIDHRRVLNLMCYFNRLGCSIKKSRDPADFQPGDIVAWDLSNGLPHIGIVTDRQGGSGKFLVVHNIGAGAQLEDVIFEWKITGHFRYFQIAE